MRRGGEGVEEGEEERRRRRKSRRSRMRIKKIFAKPILHIMAIRYGRHNYDQSVVETKSQLN